jgi:hypothetical protein
MYSKPLRRRALIPENAVGDIKPDILSSPLGSKDRNVMPGFCEKES